MRYIHDLVDQFRRLDALSNDSLVVNEDGSTVDPYVEIAAEMLGIKKQFVTFEDRNQAMRLVQTRLQQSVFQQAYTNQQGTPWGG
jgi:hypothetical protein